MLRFRTKKQKAEFTRIARERKFSLNEYILRVLEEKHEQSTKPVQTESAAGN